MSMRDRVAARKSPIHGKGVFAKCRLRDDQYIGTFEGRETETDGTYVLWLVEEDGTEVGIEGRNDLRFLNHSRKPNAELRELDLYAIRNIQPGAEIYINYGEAWDDVD